MQGNLLVLFLEGLEAATPPGYSAAGGQQCPPGHPTIWQTVYLTCQMTMTLLLPHRTTFVFCDTDPESLSTIRDDRASLGLVHDAVQVIQGDGVRTLARLLASSSSLEMSNTFAHLDPYQPFRANAEGMTTVDLLCEISKRGGKAMLWYGFDSPGGQGLFHEQLQHTFHVHGFHPAASRLWCAEVTLHAIHTPKYRFNPGVMGCGIILSNISDSSLTTCAHLGRALETLYASARLPHHQSGALTFSERLL